ncbi:hypothetical protein [Sediminicurvatus halobius]|uniref:Uncharacterized protein n=1 Tax=Sediminicurvatus halobius TaxID=2182432 RepID=A0A2U2N5P0_9GAMM|nr:hypothetical protein [Spiribacter halobius]PWG64525.1 hypothetical protein DEM34_04140 [Spiribacter halobius]UEX79153.1 hypothetical protein LMH63_05785 [Spiribacter halobius]
MVRLLFVSLLLASVATAVTAEEPARSDADEVRERFEALIAAREAEQSSGGTGNMPPLGSPLLSGDMEFSAENEALQQEAIGAYLRHVMTSNEHQLRVFRWQLLSSKIIFGVVVLLVGSGIYFAAVQFHHGLREGGGEAGSTEFEASATGVRVSSPVLGVIILTISLAFFYLYLVHVYPIEFVGT